MAVLSFPAFFGVGGPFLDIFGILGPKMGSKVPYLISGIARNGNYYLPCDFEPNPWRVDFRENCKGVPLQNFTKIDPSQIWPKIAGKVVYAISSNSSNKIGHFWAHFGPFFGVGKFFSHFLATRWGRGGLETSKMDSQCPKTPILTPHTSLNSLWGRNGAWRNKVPVPPALKKILLCKKKNYVTPCKVSEGVKTFWNMLI